MNELTNLATKSQLWESSFVSESPPSRMDSNRHGDWPLECKVRLGLPWSAVFLKALCSGLGLGFLSGFDERGSLGPQLQPQLMPVPQVYIGDLGEDATRHEIEDCFAKFGPVRNIWVAKRPPGGC